ncbi:MAG TPA: hypothetical protein VGJ92_12160 [Methanocella sp.]|jgi:hypothetical protein
MIDMDARYVYAIIIGIVAGIVLNVAHIITIVVNLISLFILPVLPLGLGLIQAILLLIFLVGTGAFTARLVRRRYGASGIKAAAVAGLVSGIVGQVVSLLISLIIAIVVAAAAAAAGYYVVGGDNPWLVAGALGIGGLVLASVYAVVQYIVLSIVFMILAGLGGFLYNHFTVTYPIKNV